MATRSLRIECRRALVRELRARFAGTPVDYGVPRGGLTEDRHIFLGSTVGTIDTPLAHPTRLPRNDDFSIDVWIYCGVGGDDTGEDADAAVLAMFDELDDLLATSPALGLEVDGVLAAGINQVDGPTPLPTEHGHESRIKATVEFSTRLQ